MTLKTGAECLYFVNCGLFLFILIFKDENERKKNR